MDLVQFHIQARSIQVGTSQFALPPLISEYQYIEEQKEGQTRTQIRVAFRLLMIDR